MTATDIAAWVGALTGTGVLVWDVFKWLRSGPRIRVSASPNMIGFGSIADIFGDRTMVAVEVTNVGSGKTTLTHLVGFHYESRLYRLLRRKPSTNFVAPNPQPGTLPHVLDAGETWLGAIEQNEELTTMSQDGSLYVGVYHSTARRPVLQRVVIHEKPKA